MSVNPNYQPRPVAQELPEVPERPRLTVRERLNKKNKEEMIKNAFFVVAVVVNLLVYPGIKTNCMFESTLYNKLFLYIVLIPDVFFRLIAAYYHRSTYMVDNRSLFLAVLAPVLSAGWWLYTLYYIPNLTQHCYEPYPSYSLLVYFLITIVIIPQAFLVICIFGFLVLFCPCLTWVILKALYEQRERSMIKERVIGSLSKIPYDPIKFRHQKNCTICFEDFQQDESITPLSCDIRHYFHTECIQTWMKEKN